MSGLARRLRRLSAGLLLAAALLAAPGPRAHALDAEEQAAVGQAFRAAGLGDWQRATRLVAPVADPLPAKTLSWLRMIEGGSADFPTMARFMIANPDWPDPERLQILAEGAIRDPADHELIRRFFADRPPLTTRGRIRYAQALFRAGEEQDAIGLIRQAWVEGDFSATEDKRFFTQYRSHLREQDHIARLDSLLWDKRLTSAGRMLGRVPAGYRALAEARMRLQRGQGGVDRAIDAVPVSLRDDPGLAFDRLHWRRERRMYDGVQAILLDPPRALARPDRWWFERELEIRRLLRRRDFDRAYRLAASHRQTEGEDFADATWLAGWLALRHANRPSEGFRRFSELYEAVSAPTDRSRAAYWAGRSAAALGDRALARSWYQVAARNRVAYYGQLAAAELGEPVAAMPLSPPDAAQRAAFEAGEIARVARMLIEVGADQELRPFAMHLIGTATSPAEVGMAADLIALSGRVDLITQAARVAAYRGQVNEAAAFPIPDLDGLLDGSKGDPEVALLLGVARQESTFNSGGMSRAGAQGLLQLMPGTAHLMARALRVPYSQARLTADPDYNIALGRHYLRTLLQRYDGEAVLAMSAYNAGPGRVEEWLALNGDPRRGKPYDLVDWLELIPFSETRNYVQRVLEARNLYRERLAGGEVARIRFQRVAGPLRPTPRPYLKPLDGARGMRLADTTAQAPRPKLKPLKTSLGPVLGPIPEVAPEAGRFAGSARLAQARATERPGQTIVAPSRMPRLPVSLDPTASPLAVLPELKPGGLFVIEAAAEPLPQPELKPETP